MMRTYEVLLVILAVAGAAYGQCDGVTNGAFVDNPASCIAFFQCVDGVPVAGNCPHPYIFYPTEAHCSYAIGDCADYWKTTTTVAPVVYDCIPGEIHWLPHATSCSKYITCFDGEAFEEECPEGLQFSPEAQSCIVASEAQCVDNPCPATSTEPEYFPHPLNCNAFFVCFSGQPKEFTCQPNYVWDVTQGACNTEADTDLSHCTAVVTPEEPEPEEPEPEEPEPEEPEPEEPEPEEPEPEEPEPEEPEPEEPEP